MGDCVVVVGCLLVFAFIIWLCIAVKERCSKTVIIVCDTLLIALCVAAIFLCFFARGKHAETVSSVSGNAAVEENAGDVSEGTALEETVSEGDVSEGDTSKGGFFKGFGK